MRGKLGSRPKCRLDAPSFNEARALCAGNCVFARSMDAYNPSFNEARALCAGNCPEAYNNLSLLWSFNEARALCAGNCVFARSMDAYNPSFNEARALCAGNYQIRRRRP